MELLGAELNTLFLSSLESHTCKVIQDQIGNGGNGMGGESLISAKGRDALAETVSKERGASQGGSQHLQG